MRALIVAGAALLAMPAGSGEARTPAVVQQVTPKAFSYVPANLTAPAPLVVLLHGAGGDARNFLRQFERDADERGVILLSVQSAGRTWAQRKPTDEEKDVADIKAAIVALSSRSQVADGRTSVMGFSDGASYALSIGLAYPELFRTIVAFSPGYAFGPAELDTTQRIFIAHSRRDPVLPAANVRAMVKAFEEAGYAPEVNWFNGGHEIDPQLRKLAFDFALAPTQTPR
ncbi:serine esterase [Sphingomonas daechungensis]|nr:alpha/beta fold hydrolase [Sphingomonas daechungensis]